MTGHVTEPGRKVAGSADQRDWTKSARSIAANNVLVNDYLRSL
jgi:hypothetical protein